MNLPQVEADVKAVSHMMRARPPSSSSSEASEASEDQGPPVDTGPNFAGDAPWRLNQPGEMRSDRALLDSGRTFHISNPYHYEDALKDGIVQEVLFPNMINHWFRNQEEDWHWRGGCRQAYDRGKPVRQLAYGNCYNCLRAGGLTQHCGFCGGDNRFHAMILFDHLDIPNTVVDARFLHRLVGYPDQDHA